MPIRSLSLDDLSEQLVKDEMYESKCGFSKAVQNLIQRGERFKRIEEERKVIDDEHRMAEEERIALAILKGPEKVKENQVIGKPEYKESNLVRR